MEYVCFFNLGLFERSSLLHAGTLQTWRSVASLRKPSKDRVKYCEYTVCLLLNNQVCCGILNGDLRLAPPVRATLIYKPIKRRVVGPPLWRNRRFFQLILEQFEFEIIELRFFTKAFTRRL